jgi:hypothetical protein
VPPLHLIREFRRLCRVAVLAAACLLPAMAADPGLIQLAHPDVNVMIGLRLRSLSQAPSLKFQIEESERLGLPETTTPAWESVKQMLGSDPLRYFEEVVLAARVRSFDERTEPEHVLLLVSGPYDETMVQEVCEKAGGCETDAYRGVTMRYVRGAQRDMADDPAWFAVFEGRYAAVGKRVDIENLLDRRAAGHQRGLSPAMAEWLGAAGELEAWFAAQGPFDWSTPEGTASGGISPAWSMIAATLKQTFAKVDGALLTLSLQSGYSLSLKLNALTEPEVETLEADVRRGWEWLQEQAGAYAPQSAEAAGRFAIHREGRLLTASIYMSQQEVEEQIRKQLLQRAEQLKGVPNREEAPGEPGPGPATGQPNPGPGRGGGVGREGRERPTNEAPAPKP